MRNEETETHIDINSYLDLIDQIVNRKFTNYELLGIARACLKVAKDEKAEDSYFTILERAELALLQYADTLRYEMKWTKQSKGNMRELDSRAIRRLLGLPPRDL
jgi:hypothetical protein